MLVGDLLIEVRELIPDLPRTLNAPTGATAAAQANAAATLPTANYYVKVVGVNTWGETLPSNEVGPIAITIGVNGIRVSTPTIASIPGATKVRVYFGTTAQQENQWAESSVVPFDILAPGNPGQPPIRSTAFYPDADGQFLSAYTLYRWLNSALEQASVVAGGIPDISGCMVTGNQPLYTLEGEWRKMDAAWYNGWPMSLGSRKDAFYFTRTSSSYPWVVIAQLVSNRVMVELQNIPVTSGAQTTLAAQLGLTDNQAQLTSTASFNTAINLVKIGTEICAFGNITGSNLVNLIRGLGGTVQSAWPQGTAVQELNFRFSGLRLHTSGQYQFVVGDALKTINIPTAWREPIVRYMLSKARTAEQDFSQQERDLQFFIQAIKGLMQGNRVVVGPRQIGGSSERDAITFPGLGSRGGGVIVP